jgi:hypothetical protein
VGGVKPDALTAIRSLLLALLLAGAAVFSGAAAAATSPLTVAQNEPNAAGDIPDTQAFVRYNAPAGYSIRIPEGWSRTIQGTSATFTSHYDGVRIVVRPRSSPATALRGIADRPAGVKLSTVTIGRNRVTRLTFTSPSQPDPVTGKSVRLDDEAYVFVKGPREAVVHVWAPHGADNADQWQKIAQSFRW